MFKVIGGVVVYGFALYGLAKYLHKRASRLQRYPSLDTSLPANEEAHLTSRDS